MLIVMARARSITDDPGVQPAIARQGEAQRDVQAVADEAEGIAARVAGMLGVHRGSDLFHGLHELGPVLGALHGKLAEAEAAAEATRAAQRAAQGTPRAAAARATHAEHRSAVRRLRHRIETAVECLRGLSAVFHPVDLATGERVAAPAVGRQLEQLLARLLYAYPFRQPRSHTSSGPRRASRAAMASCRCDTITAAPCRPRCSRRSR
jgi:hypothetical protein